MADKTGWKPNNEIPNNIEAYTIPFSVVSHQNDVSLQGSRGPFGPFNHYGSSKNRLSLSILKFHSKSKNCEIGKLVW